MRRVVVAMIAGAALAIPAAAQFDPGSSGAHSFHRPGDAGWQEAAFVCDGVSTDHAFVLTRRDGRRVTLWRYAKPGLAATSAMLRIGQGDAGMSQQHYPLLDASGRTAAVVNLVSPAVVEPGATTPTITSVRMGRTTTDCRFAPQTRVLGIAAKRSVQVVALPDGGYRYTAYTHGAALAPRDLPWAANDSEATLTLDGGRLVNRTARARTWVFTNAGYTYRVIASADPQRPGGGIEVLHGGRLIAREPFGAYAVADAG